VTGGRIQAQSVVSLVIVAERIRSVMCDEGTLDVFLEMPFRNNFIASAKGQNRAERRTWWPFHVRTLAALGRNRGRVSGA
jgi:hypothetical protein